MANFVSITLITFSLWVFPKSGTDGLQLLSPNGDAIVSHRYEDGKQQMDTSVLPENNDERSIENDESPSFLIKKFGTLFTDAILSSNRLSSMYDTSLSPEQAAEAYYRIFMNAMTNVHAYHPREVSVNVSIAVKSTFGKLTLAQHVQAYGYSAAKLMKSMNVLTRENVKKLCDSYVGFNEVQAEYVPDISNKRFVFIEAIFNSLVLFTTSLDIYNGKSAELLFENFVMFLYKLTGIKYVPPNDPCSANNVVDIFANQFAESVMKTPKLREIYDTSLPPKEAEEAFFRVIANAVANVHTYDASGVTRICSDAIGDTFGSLNMTQHVLSHAYAAGEYLQSTKTLTCESLGKLVDFFLSYVEEAVRNVPSISDRRVAFIQALADGFDHFMSALDLFTPDGVVLMCQNFASSLYFLTGIPNIHHYEPPVCSTGRGDIFF